MHKSTILTTCLLGLSFLLFVGKSTYASPDQQTQASPGDTSKTAKAKKAVVAPPVDNTPIPNSFPYHASRTRYSDLTHTKLYVSFDWKTRTMPGKAYLTLEPYFYPTDSLTLDAKGFIVNRIALVRGTQMQDLKFVYSGNRALHIQLDRLYKKGEPYEVMIDYVAQPDKLPLGGSAAITSDKGLYFINPDNTEKNKPMQIWTQGETESNSCWFPTIDSPNQRQTSEIYMTVNDSMTTLSNGLLVDSHKNADGSRTDHWSQTKPHAPYLIMLAVGHFAVVKDQWHGMPVNYYVEPAYAKYAKLIFGETPQMIEFFSNCFGVKYPWSKYSQVVIRDYVSGAMENTTAVTFNESYNHDDRANLDNNGAGTIAHELSHHWFGDYLTTESWPNITLNEGFATYNVYLWFEHRYGKEEADKYLDGTLRGYFRDAENKREPIIRYHYQSQEDLFDGHSYNKGGCVIHMLRKEVGDDAFFASLKLYLTRNALHSVEIDQLRQAFEEVTGRDLKWFFDQWYLKPGHPELAVTYTTAPGQVQVKVQQTQSLKFQPVFELHTKVELTEDGHKRSLPIVITNTDTTFAFATSGKLENVDFDPDKVLLGKITESRPRSFWLSQLQLGSNYKQKSDAISHLAADVENDTVRAALLAATQAPFWSLRQEALNALGKYSKPTDPALVERIMQIAHKDNKSSNRAAAYNYMAAFVKGDSLLPGSPTKAQLAAEFQTAIKDSSYAVVSAGLNGLYAVDKVQGLAAVQQNMGLSSNAVFTTSARILFTASSPKALDYVINGTYSRGNYQLISQNMGPYVAQLQGADQQKAISFLEDKAQHDSQWYMRLAGVQALLILKDKPEIQAFLKDLKAKETLPQLVPIYAKQIPF